MSKQGLGTGRAKRRWLAVPVIAVTSMLVLGTVAAGAKTSSQSTPGYDGKTIKVAGLISAPVFPDAGVGAQARFKRANDTNELKGVKIQYVETADDKNDLTTSISEARRLVEQDGVFAVVPAVSGIMGTYLQTAKVPYFGWGLSTPAYCMPGATGYGFGWSGCLLPTAPKAVPAFSSGTPYTYLTKTLGIKNPTIAGNSSDSAGGTLAMKSFIAQATASGFKVVYAQHNLPNPPAVVGDYTPYAQAVMATNGGKGPDLMWFTTTDATFNMTKALLAAGYKGQFESPYYAPVLVKTLSGQLVVTPYSPFEQKTPASLQMAADLTAFKPGTLPTVGDTAGYLGADFFIKALQKAGTKGLTRAKLQQAAAHMTFQLKGMAGPTQYPRAFQALNSYCTGLLKSDGTAFTVVEPYTCTNKFVKVKKGAPDSIG